MEGLQILLNVVKSIGAHIIQEQGSGLLAWALSAILTGVYLCFLGLLTFLIGKMVLSSTRSLRNLRT